MGLRATGWKGSVVSKSREYVPQRGDAVWVDLDPRVGHEQSGRRPALVLSPHRYNHRTGLALLCPITSHAKGYPFEVPLPNGSPVTGVIGADQVRSLNWRARKATRIGTVSKETVAEVLARLGVLIFEE